MLVRITPPGRSARVFRVADVPRSWHIDGGCAAAAIPLALSDEDAERILLARVDVFGPLGLDWAGMVWRRPRYGEPIECAGLVNTLTFNRREALYSDTRTSEWSERTSIVAQRVAQASKGFDLLQVAFLEDESYPAGAWNGHARRIPNTTKVIASVTWTRPSVAYQLRVRAAYESDTFEGFTEITSTQFEVSAGYGALSGTATRTVERTGGIDFVTTAATLVSGGQPTSDRVCTFSIKLFLVDGVKPVTPEAVIDDCLDYVPTWALPTGEPYRAFVGTSDVEIDSLVFDDPMTDDKKKVDTVVGFSDHHFGFYARRVAGQSVVVPVYEAIETEPSLMLDVARMPDESLRDRSADEMASQYLVSYKGDDGSTRYLTVSDPDDSSYLARIGYEITGVVDAGFTTSATLATAAGTVTAARSEDVEGTATVLRARTASGRQVPGLACMPGRLARVHGLGRDRLLTVASAEAEGAQVRVSFARKSTDLAYLAARALGR